MYIVTKNKMIEEAPTEEVKLPYLPPEIIQHIAYFSGRRERRILGFTMELCIFLNFPPDRIGSHTFIEPKWRISNCPHGCGTYWASPNSSRGSGMGIHRIANGRKDDYSINDIKYTYTFNYDNGHIWHWIDDNEESAKGHSVTEIHQAYQSQSQRITDS